MSLYVFEDLFLEVQPADLEEKAGLPGIWPGLSWLPAAQPPAASQTRLLVRLHAGSRELPRAAVRSFQTAGFSIFEDGAHCYVSDGLSLFHLQSDLLEGDAHLHASFFAQPAALQSSFWSYGLLKLLRRVGLYSLHAAGVVTPEGDGTLIIGASGSGKSTLALGMIREGYGYLSDDAVLLASKKNVEAFALRKDFYVDASAASRYPDLPVGAPVRDSSGGDRCRLFADELYRHRRVARCTPKLLLFPRIVREDRSSMTRLQPVEALKCLLDASGAQLFDRGTMGEHLETLNRLLKQAPAYAIRSGRDLYDNPGQLLRLIQTIDMRGSRATNGR